MRRALVLATILLLFSACQQTPVSHKPVSAVSPAEQLRLEGDAFMAKADYGNAVEKYRQSIDLEPTVIPPRFALGTAYSFLDKRPEAIVQLRWVVDHADVTSTEYQEAHRWLARVGALVASPVAAVESAPQDQKRVVDPATAGRLVGRTEWPGITPRIQLITGNLSLIGDEPTTQDVKRNRAFRLGDAYDFKDVPPGRYRVVAVIDETKVWDEKVTVAAGKDTSLTLSQSTSPVPAGKYTPAAKPAEEPGPAASR